MSLTNYSSPFNKAAPFPLLQTASTSSPVQPQSGLLLDNFEPAITSLSKGASPQSNLSLDKKVTHHSIEVLENSVEVLDHNTQVPTGCSLIKTILTCMALAAAMGLLKYVRTSMSSEEDVDSLDLTTEDALTTAFAVTSGYVGRRLLSSIPTPSILSFIQNQISTEEVPFNKQWYNDDIFETASDYLTISAKQTNGAPLPTGLSLTNTRMQAISSLSSCFASVSYASCITYSNNYAFVGTSEGLQIVDVSNPSEPFPFPPTNLGGYITAFEIRNNICYTVSTSEVSAIDITDPYNPILLGSFQLNLPPHNSIKIDDDFCYFIGIDSGSYSLFIMDITHPTNLTTVSSISLPLMGGVNDIFIDSGYCYINGQRSYGASNSMILIDIQNPLLPVLMGDFMPQLQVLSMEIVNNTGYTITMNNLYILDLTNPSNPDIIGSFESPFELYDLKMLGDNCFVTSNNGGQLLQKIDVSNQTAPVLRSTAALADCAWSYASIAASNTNAFLLCSANTPSLVVTTLGDSFSLSGTPAGGTQGSYNISLTAKDTSNARVSQTFTLEVQPAVTLTDSVPNQKAIVGSTFNFVFVQAFKQINNAALIYKAKLINSSLLPSWLGLNGVSGTLSGVPSMTDTGVLNVQLVAQDTAGASALTTCQITVLNGPTLSNPIPNQVTTIGNPYNYTVNANTFIDNDGLPLTYTATKNGGDLPSWLTFDVNSLTLSGVPTLLDGGTFPITITAQDPTGTSFLTSFNLNVVTELPPTLFNPISNLVATVGQAFKFVIPANTFTDNFVDEITYTVRTSDGSPLPAWLSYDEVTRTFSGTPSYGDTNSFADRILQITIIAKGIQAVQTASFNINVTGKSIAALALSIAAPAASAASVAYTIYKTRHLFWNTCRKSRYRKPAETAIIGKPYEHKISIPRKEIKTIQARLNGKDFSEILPQELKFDFKTNSLKSTCIEDDGEFNTICIRIVDHQGFNREEFNLHIKNESEAPLVADEMFIRSLRGAGTFLNNQNPNSEGLELSPLHTVIASDEHCQQAYKQNKIHPI